MRRPVCLFALIFTAAVCAAVLFLPSQQDICLKAEGRYVTLQGVVGNKEYALNSPGNEQYLRMTLENVTSETEVPRESAFEIRRGDKIMCILEDEPETQEKWAAVGAIVRIRGKIRLFKRPSNDGEFDAFLYYREIGGYLFTLADAHILSYNNEKDPLRAPLYDSGSTLQIHWTGFTVINTEAAAGGALQFLKRCCWDRTALSKRRSGSAIRLPGSFM